MSEHGTWRFEVDTSSATRALDRIRALLPAPWEHGRDQKCDERCVCPVHGTPLLYAPASSEHACQDINCVHGHGMQSAGPVRPDEEPTR